MRRFITLLLRGLPARLVTADDEGELLSVLDSHAFPVAIVVADANGWPGCDVAQALRDACAHSSTETVFLSHEPPAGDWTFVDAFVCLPFASHDLVSIVSRLLSDPRDPPTY